jgi:hypothetical protein
LRFRLNRPSRRARYGLRHAHTGCPYPRTHPADASAAWRRSPQMDPKPQPHAGALAGAAAGPAGRAAIETPYAAKAALSDAPGIGAGPPRSQTTPPHGAMQRGRRRRGKSGGPPPPSRADTSAARPRFSLQNTQIRLGGVEPFSLRPDKILPGTLHHSGIRPAPPSDHTPLARRSAFQPGQSGPPGRNSNARAGLERLDSADERACQLRS